MGRAGNQPSNRGQLFREHHLCLQTFQIVIGVLRVSKKMCEPAIEQLLTCEYKNCNHQHRGKAERNTKSTNLRRILQPLKREQGDCRYAGGGKARDPFWDGKPSQALLSTFVWPRSQLACVESNPRDVCDGDRERKIPQAAAGVAPLLNKNVDNGRGGSVEQEADQILIVDLLPCPRAVLRKVEQTDDGCRQLRVIKQVEIAVERSRREVKNLPHERELEVQVNPPARDQSELQ